jgi:opacity protein-like surface antigen
MHERMKVWLLLSISLLICSTTFAAKSVDLTASVASEPVDDFGAGFGITAGLSLDVADFAATNNVTKNLQLRGDMSYYHWSRSVILDSDELDLSYSRVPIFLGARYMVPKDKLRLYGEVGLEISFDKVSVAEDFRGVPITASDTDTHLGLVPGAGIQYFLTDNVFVGGNFRLHIIDDSYVSAGIALGTQFK